MSNIEQPEKLHILLIEDNDAHAEIVIRSFKKHRIPNYVTHLKDGKAALDYLFFEGEFEDKDVELPHIVLLDLRLPRIDGLEVLKRIKTDRGLSKLPVIVLTTSAAEKDAAMAYDYHANSYLVKPMDYEEFKELLDSIGHYWMSWNQDPWDKGKLDPPLDIGDLI